MAACHFIHFDIMNCTYCTQTLGRLTGPLGIAPILSNLPNFPGVNRGGVGGGLGFLSTVKSADGCADGFI